MALYEYLCPACGARTEKRMPMADVVQLIPCPKCGKQARKVLGGFALVGISEASAGDGPAPWEDGGDDGDGGSTDSGKPAVSRSPFAGLKRLLGGD
ncbi:MAG TPA: zinc ribbon domain-containing protein [Tepidiformaceae bacterium]|nr:zinc ribbon domain-containing protein [Tepidiformaceae bacterium]